MTEPILGPLLDETFAALQQAEDAVATLQLQEVGRIASLGKGVARVTGLPGVGSEELLIFPGGTLGLVLNIDEHDIGVVLLGEYRHLRAGDEVQRSGKVLDVPVGEGLIGRVLDPTGAPLDELGSLANGRRCPVERGAPEILDRLPVTVPLLTGLKVIDALIPIGRGQRELLLGDRQTGKTAIALDTIINQKDQDVLCFYCAIGQRSASVANVVAELTAHGAMNYSTVIIAEGDDPPGLQYVAPYAATAMAEFFMEQGRDVLVVYDDLTHHARAYRELSLLLRRPPGREAFPGDIFYLHSRLLERSTHLSQRLGGGSLTALPIIETEAQNLSAYIPTNLISITDGQIYLSPDLFQKGLLPPVNIGKSVSRVGGKTQLSAYRTVAGDLKLSYSQFEELEVFSRFGTRLDTETRKSLIRGQRIRSILKQAQFSPLPPAEQVLILYAATQGLFDAIAEADLAAAEAELRKAIAELPEFVRSVEQNQLLSEQLMQQVLAAASKTLSSWREKSEAD
jgi:F-type H+-transporting ATPase subunit alpha